MFARLLAALALAAAALTVSLPDAAAEEAVRIAIHVDDNDPRKMNLALNNAANVTKYYEAQGREVEIEIVAYGPGLHMLRADTSPVKARISAMSLALPNLSFAACGNTKAKMEAKSGAPVTLIEEAALVPSGVVRLVELQREGWAYIKP